MNKDTRALYRSRRANLAEMMGSAIFIMPSAAPRTRNSGVDYPFRQESGFLYLTGWTEPNAFLIIEGGTEPRSTIFFNEQNAHDRLWNGKKPTHKDAVRKYGFDDARSLYELIPALEQWRRLARIFYRGVPAECLTPRNIFPSPYALLAHDGMRTLAELRIIKDDTEIAVMRRAARITGLAHRHLMETTHSGMYEYALAAAFTHQCARLSADPLNAYPSIVAAGENACTLHYVKLTEKIRSGDLVLVDAGCELGGYASDVTRTFPANGKWSEEQRLLYEIVLSAQKSAIASARVGNTIGDVHRVATLAIAEGLVRLGIISEFDAEAAIRSGAVKRFFPHGTSHWLGLDVHDVGDYRVDAAGNKNRGLEPGMVITVEPGIYIPKTARNVDKKWRGIGIRIEDDVLITKGGNDVLSCDAPKEVDEIHEVMRDSCT